MKSATKHIVISTVLCALTLVVFLAFYNRLPESIPIHFDSAGVANSFWPRNVVVFGVPVACGDEVNCPNKNFGGGTVIFLNVILKFF